MPKRSSEAVIEPVSAIRRPRCRRSASASNQPGRARDRPSVGLAECLQAHDVGALAQGPAPRRRARLAASTAMARAGCRAVRALCLAGLSKSVFGRRSDRTAVCAQHKGAAPLLGAQHAVLHQCGDGAAHGMTVDAIRSAPAPSPAAVPFSANSPAAMSNAGSGRRSAATARCRCAARCSCLVADHHFLPPCHAPVMDKR